MKHGRLICVDSIYSEFYEAADELDELTLEGFFGENARKLLKQRESVTQTEYFSNILDDWNTDLTQYGKPKVKEFMLLFLGLFLDAYLINSQITVEILASYWKGTKENPELEGVSGYTETIRFHKMATHMMDELKEKQVQKASEKKNAVSAFITSYSKSVEYIGQVLTPCVLLAKLSKLRISTQFSSLH
jgi:hypothetical protein